MQDMERTVAANEPEMPEIAETPADDAQAAEVSAEELIESLQEAREGETAETTGDGGQAAGEDGGEDDGRKEDKTGRRIAAALKQQRKTIFAELGMDEAQVRELVLAHKAEQMAKDDPDISPKAARRILEAQSGGGADTAKIAGELRTLAEDGWTGEELRQLTQDRQVIADVNGGMSVRRAARAYLRRMSEAHTATDAEDPTSEPSFGGRGRSPRKGAVPTMRAGSAQGAAERDPIAAMTDKQFAEFSQRAYEAMLAGKSIRL